MAYLTGAAKVGDAVFRLIEIKIWLSGALVVARSGHPSLLKSPSATEPTWLEPRATGINVWNVPSPLPNRMLAEPVSSEATARSRNPSWLISPTTTFQGALPTVYGTAFWNVPSPFPSRITTWFRPELVATRSATPSRLKSPVAISLDAVGAVPVTPTGKFLGVWKVPSPLPR